MRIDESLSPLIEADEGGLLSGLIRRVRTASRQKRARLFHSLFEIRADTRILDLGGGDGTHIHYLLAATAARRENVCVADIDREAVALAAMRFGYRAVALAENAGLPFASRAFDIVVCSSVLEHVTIPKREIWRERSGSEFSRRARAEQQRFAGELRRVAAGYFVQVPNRGFPIETHSWLPFLGIAPRPLQCRVIHIANRVWIKKTIPDFYLPTADEMARYFPGASLVRERFLGLTKSLIAVRRVQKPTRIPMPATVAS